LIVCRSRYSLQLAHLISMFKARGKKVHFDIDDLVFDSQYVPLVLHSLSLDLNNNQHLTDWFGYCARMGEVLRMADSAICTNSFLAEKIAHFHSIPVHVIPNFMNQAQLEYSEKIVSIKACTLSKANDFTLGYFSGSPSHWHDFEIIEDTLVNLFRKYKHVRLTLVGYIKASSKLNGFRERIDYYPFHNYVALQKLIAQVDVNLVPLQINDFTNCKSELKYFEASIVKTLTVASNAFTYLNAIRDGQNGKICLAHQWFDVLSAIIEGSSAYSRYTDTAYDHSKQCYSWKNQYAALDRVFKLSC
jgi:glycosyltransferase involved in cell wall biosynthesis